MSRLLNLNIFFNFFLKKKLKNKKYLKNIRRRPGCVEIFFKKVGRWEKKSVGGPGGRGVGGRVCMYM